MGVNLFQYKTETLTDFGKVNNPVSTNFPNGEGQHNYDGYDNIYVAYPLEIITNNAYSIKRDVDRREFLRSYFTDLTADVVDEVKDAVAASIEALSDEPTITEVDGIYFNIGKGDAITAFDAHIGGKIGHYTDAAVTAYKAAVVAAETAEELTAAKNAVLTSDNWNKPVSGKAYTFKNVQKDGTTVRWYKYDATGNNIVLTANESEATPFVCRLLENGKYVFVCNGGKYMTWRAVVYGCTTTGVHDGYEEDHFLTDITIAKMTTANNIDGNLSTTRYVSISAKRPDKDEMGYVVVKKNNGSPTFDGAGAAFYNDNYSSAFIMDEVTPPTVTISNLGYSTLYSEVPLSIPDGVKAYTGEYNETASTLTLNKIADVIPANTGVVLESEVKVEKTFNFTIVADDVEAITGNALRGTATDILTSSVTGGVVYTLQPYTGGDETYKLPVVFMRYADDNNPDLKLKAGKAYLLLPADENGNVAQSISIRFEGSTDIENVEIRNEKSEMIFDLLGRRVETMTKGGIYIVNGKKVIK